MAGLRAGGAYLRNETMAHFRKSVSRCDVHLLARYAVVSRVRCRFLLLPTCFVEFWGKRVILGLDLGIGEESGLQRFEPDGQVTFFA